MAYGLQLMNASGTVVFDTNTATGGVCVGRYSVATTGSSFTFPAYAGRTNGRFIYANGVPGPAYSFDTTLGYPRFNFDGNGFAAYDVLLFIF